MACLSCAAHVNADDEGHASAVLLRQCRHELLHAAAVCLEPLRIFDHLLPHDISDRLERVGALKRLVILRARVGRTGAVEGDLAC